MAFHLFGRKPRPVPLDAAGSAPDRPVDRQVEARSIAEQRELARHMAARIDQIESEMMGSQAGAGETASSVSGIKAVASPSVNGAEDPARTGIVLADSGLSPGVEEAAILFANAEARAAAEVLASQVAQGSPDAGNPLAWAMLFQAQRACEARAEFDEAALNYAARFGGPAPVWGCLDASDAPPGARAACALSGEVVGLAPAQLALLRGCADAEGEVVVDCRTLSRIDFPAAGALLNEVIAIAAEGRRVVFDEPGPAVEALMIVMGIHEVAVIRRRKIRASSPSDGSASA